MSDNNNFLDDGFDFGDGSENQGFEATTPNENVGFEPTQPTGSNEATTKQPVNKNQASSTGNQQGKVPFENRKPRSMQSGNTEKPSNALPNPNNKVEAQMSKKQQAKIQKQQAKMQKQQEKMQKQQAKVQAQVPQKQGIIEEPAKKKGKGKKLLIGVLALAVACGGGYVASTVFIQKPMEQNYEASGKKVLDNLLPVINNYDAESVDATIGVSTGDSYLAQEWSYANNNEVRQNFIKFVCNRVKFSYPLVSQLSTKGEVMTDKSGNPIQIESFMNNGENLIVTVIDYDAIAKQMVEDADFIDDMKILANIKNEDYDFQDKCFDLMLEYVMQLETVPTTEVEVPIVISGGTVTDDSGLDTALFASDSFHNMCDAFDKLMTGFTGVTTETYTVKEEVENPEYDEWYKIFKERYDSDNGVFNKSTSLWEPWYVYDENNQVQYDENGEILVRYYSVKDENGNDWIQPPKTVWQNVEKTREVPVEYVPEIAVPYCFLGAYYAQNTYDGEVPSDVRVGDGSIEHTAGVGTPIITTVQDINGEYHDIKVTLKGYWIKEDAIDYAVSFSEKNRGFDPDSPVQLICYEIQVDNLENKEFTFNSEMFLCDKNASGTGRTGTMYEFTYENIEVDAKGSVIFNDWATSTELEQKYVAWGKSFNRQYEPVFFKVLAGTGEVPTYSAYKEFTGNSIIEETAETEEQYANEVAEQTQNTDDIGNKEVEAGLPVETE